MKLYVPFLCLVASLALSGCGPNSESVTVYEAPGSISPPTVAAVRAYSASSPYAETLRDCIGDSPDQYNCPLTRLPFLGMEEGAVTDAAIKDRLLVSHSWMGDRFMAVLKHFPDEAKHMFGSVTAVVIASDIRPSFYLTESGAIYIDPDYLWLSNAEKRTISKHEDYRSGFGDELSLVTTVRLIKNNDYAYPNSSLDDASERAMKDIIYPVMSLLFHELTHANDFVPSARMTSANPEQTAFEAITAWEEQTLATTLYADAALTSEELTDLGEVLFFGTPATHEQRAMSASYAGALFANDGANAMYAYSNQHEDIAMLMEAVLMKRYFDVDLDVGFLQMPENPESAWCDDYIVGWGERNRIANPRVTARAQRAAQLVMPELSWEAFFQTGVGEFDSMRFGQSWCDNLVLSGPVSRNVERRSEGHETIRLNDFIRSDHHLRY